VGARALASRRSLISAATGYYENIASECNCLAPCGGLEGGLIITKWKRTGYWEWGHIPHFTSRELQEDLEPGWGDRGKHRASECKALPQGFF